MVEGTLRFSRDGAKCVCVVIKGDKRRPAVGESLGAEFAAVMSAEIDPSGAHTLFRVRESDPKKKFDKCSLVYDGKIIASDDWIGPVALDPNGVPAYWIAHGRVRQADGSAEPGPATLVWGKYKSSKWQFSDAVTPPMFSRDGKLLTTTCARGQGDFNVLTVDEKGKDDKHGSGSIFEATPRPTGREVAYCHANLVGEDRWQSYQQHLYVMTESLDPRGETTWGSRVGEQYDSAGCPVYSADGQHLACKVMRSSKMGVAIDDQADAACDYTFVDELAPTSNGSAVAFVASNGCKLDYDKGLEVLRGVEATGGKWYVVHGKVRSAEYDAAHFPTWSPDGKVLAYTAKSDGKWRVYIDSKQGEPCDEIACIAWSEDGHAVWYGCRRGSELRWERLEAG
jgi:Tol biopolymer transport system component